jgi:hypothetical protein
MPTYKPMSMYLETGRLTLRPWTASDVDDYHALVSERDHRARRHERGDGMPTVENIRGRIATQLAATAQTGIALLPVRRRIEGDFIGYCGLIVGRATVEEPEIAYELLRRAQEYGLRDGGSRSCPRCCRRDRAITALVDGQLVERAVVPRPSKARFRTPSRQHGRRRSRARLVDPRTAVTKPRPQTRAVRADGS